MDDQQLGASLSEPREGARLPTAKQALWVVLVALLLSATVGTALQLADLLPGIVATEILCILGPVAAVLLLRRLQVSRSLRLMWPGRRVMGWALLMAPAASILAGEVFWLQSRLLPVPTWYLDMMERLAEAGRDSGVWLGVLSLSVLPAVAEETLFRGFVLTGLRTRFRTGSAVILTAVLFALMHVDPFRFLPVLLLGGILGFMTATTGSLYPAILVHALNNVLLLVPPEWSARAGMSWLEKNQGAPLAWVVGSGAMLAVSCFFLKRDRGAHGGSGEGGGSERMVEDAIV